jgi:hypothetical protein
MNKILSIGFTLSLVGAALMFSAGEARATLPLSSHCIPAPDCSRRC